MKNNIYSVIGMGLLFVIVQIIAIAIAPIYSHTQSEAMGGRETIENPSFAFFYLGIILLFTFVILWIAKRKKEKFIKVLILAAIFMTMVYLFIPLNIAIMYPSSGDGWKFTEVDADVVALEAEDIDGDGVIEIIAGCADNRIRVYESENHTLEWESGDLGSNITQILADNLDNDEFFEIAVVCDTINVFSGENLSNNWTLGPANLSIVAAYDLNANGTSELIVGTENASIMIFESGLLVREINVSSNLHNISHLDTTDDGQIVAADNTTIILLDPATEEILLKITEREEINALLVVHDPSGEDNLIVADANRVYFYNLASSEFVRRGPKFRDVEAMYLEYYSIPDYKDDIPDVIAFGDDTVYFSPDLLKERDSYYYLRFRYDVHSILSKDLDADGDNEMIMGVDEGYRHTSIVFGEGANMALPIIIAIVIAFLLTLIVHKYPEWYVVDAVGLVMAIGATVILGVTFAILPAIVLLLVLAIYDAISVYKTKHMISLADSVIDLNLPVLLVIPKKLGYSFRKEKPRLKEQLESGEEREAMFMGLGDIVIPSLLIVSALSFLPDTSSGIGVPGNLLVCIGTMIGILIGFSVLMRYVMKGNPQAGLPLLNSGAITGYIITYIIVFGNFGFGFNLNFI
ncbi:MAG: hypothetical protein JSW00_00360 [Thermoplasmata archaeon]|nr:MAG: hypothetical protein JSW00_00360 [Thermoplasmata archaeon]